MMVSEAEKEELVLCRLKTMPTNIRISLGSGRELARNYLIRHVKEGDRLGKLIVETQLDYLRSMKGL